MTTLPAFLLAVFAVVAHTSMNVALISSGASDPRWIVVQVVATVATGALMWNYYRRAWAL